jgi:hypothetical protein
METGKLTETFRDRTVSVIKQNELSAGEHSEFPKFVTGIKGLAEVLSVSPSMVNRWKASGLPDEATCQNGKYVLFDVYGVLEILRVNNRKNKYNVKN